MKSVLLVVCAETEVPSENDWLSPDEINVLSGFSFEKRRREWRLGRWAAKQVFCRAGFVSKPRDVTILAASDGAPEARMGGSVPPALSLSHREGVGLAALHEGPVGCDLELIEPRSALFVGDFFTEREQSRCRSDFDVAVHWSAKESALKVTRAGLRRDTRSVELVRLDEGKPWGEVVVEDRIESRSYFGWWRRIFERHIVTVMSTTATLLPRIL